MDVSKCFNWQKSNSICLFGLDGDRAQSESFSSNSLLSFENEEFVKRFSYKETLDYAFFVKQGRPFFAYNLFFKNQLNKFGKLHKTL